jgi:hypothetical protein
VAINIGMTKLWEDAIWVYYEFDTTATEKDPATLDQPHPKVIRSWEAYGYCKFNKQTGQFILDEEKTDPYLLERRKFVNKVRMVLSTIQESGELYPERTGYSA